MPVEAAIDVTTPTNDRFLRACRLEPVDSTPVWFMRQAGRSLPEYRALRAKHGILEICTTSELAVEATLQPVRRLGVDAAILFSDIVVPLQAMGVELDIREGVGPVIPQTIRSRDDLRRIQSLEPERDMPEVIEAVRALAGELDVPLIGFGGGPFTLATYLVEGGPSKSHARTKAFMYQEPETWRELLARLGDAVLASLRAQVRAGASAVQLFDSWIGALSVDDYSTYVLPTVERILAGLGDLGVPRIYFGIATGELLPLMARAGADVVGLDWRVPLNEARRRVGPDRAVQGNLEPAACLAPWHVLRAKAAGVLERGGGRGHVFNLGHGVLPETDPHVLARLVEFVHEWSGDG